MRRFSTFLLTLFTMSQFLSCGKSKDDDTLSMFMLLGFMPFSGLNFQFASSSRASTSSHPAAASRSEGDGTGDGFPDVFLTPSVMSLVVCDVVGFLPESEGGPAPGTETFENGVSIVDPSSGVYANGRDCVMGFHVAIREGELGYIYGADLSEMGTTYDRIGLVLKSVNVFFPPEKVSDPNRRYWQAYYSNYYAYDNWFIERGLVTHTVLLDSCPAELASNGALVDIMAGATMGDWSCQTSESPRIAVADGKMGALYESQTPLFPMQHTQSAYLSSNDAVSFNLPADISRFGYDQAYVVVLPVSTLSKKPNGITIEVIRENMLFFDSDDGDQVFSPESSSGDRPDVTDAGAYSSTSERNLKDSSRRNLILNAPGFQIQE
ncbi:sigma factor sigX-regulated lipoprotein SrpA [Leptonema illini]|uniref:Uncharacterized protein n=1 Tax=Leptonema illini DSM 21528 TaxID=929563 RepID=H2CGH7_9LEPT|nr:hypothetical protein [Leptonema illini]EHQ07894.1 hypothetical protein Lepil_3232 [Leptonema illini DSM 21528]